MTFEVLQGWALITLAITGPPSLAWALSKFWFWNGKDWLTSDEPGHGDG